MSDHVPSEHDAWIWDDRDKTKDFAAWERQGLRRLHSLVFCSECGRVSVWASPKVAEPQRNWHELQHLEGVMGKQTVVQVRVIQE